jgi:2-polyprenyl-6-methoxyphenol hydroxylase-like FAD-dependent oxidoreductase
VRTAQDGADVVIVGAGIAGATLAAALARSGAEITVLEAATQYRDRVRGESLLAWGVREARRLGAEQALLAAGAHLTAQWVRYSPEVPAATARENPIPVGSLIPGIAGSLNICHPDACAALATAAEAAGARIIRGARVTGVRPGKTPLVQFTTSSGRPAELTARLVVGADGRSGRVRRLAGIPLRRQPAPHMITGLLVDGLADVPDDHDFLAAEDSMFIAGFHQGLGRLRLYMCPGLAQRQRFAGPGGTHEFLRACAFGCLPFGRRLAQGRPAGPIATYPADDTWTDQPYTCGVVLIGDAAGHNNPIIGQGLSLAMRDARLVADAIRQHGFTTQAFRGYGADRAERMRRVRAAAAFMAASFAEDCPDRAGRRARFAQLQQTEPLATALLTAIHAGPETAPPEAFNGRLTAAIRSQPRHRLRASLTGRTLPVAALAGPQPRDGPADEVAPLLAQPGLVGFRRLREREPRSAEHPEGEPDQAAHRPVRQVARVDQGGDEALDEPVRVLLLALPPAVPAERGRPFQPHQAAVGRFAALVEERVESLERRLQRVRGGGGGGDRRDRPGLLRIQYGLEQGLFPLEVVVHRTAGHLAGRRHVFEGRSGVPVRGEQAGRLVEQRRPGGLGVQLPSALDLWHT